MLTNAEKCFNYLFSDRTAIDDSAKNPLSDIVRRGYLEGFVCRYPHSIHWELTSACNLRCKHCLYANSNYKAENEFTPDELMNLAHLFVEKLNVIKIAFSGGEIFLRNDFYDVLNYLKSKNVFLVLMTNGILISEEVVNKLDKILNKKNDIIQISLDGITKETYESIRGENTFDKAIRGIKLCTDKGFMVRVSYTVTSKNVHELPMLHEYCKRLGVAYIGLGRFQTYNEFQSYLKPNLEDVVNYTAKFVDSIDGTIKVTISSLKLFDFLNFDEGIKLADNYLKSFNGKPKDDLMCDCHGHFGLRPNGEMYLCADTEIEGLSLGNIREQSFDDIWDNRFSNCFYQKRVDLVCKKCKYLAICGGGCPGKAYNAYKTVNAPDGNCLYGKKLMESEC